MIVERVSLADAYQHADACLRNPRLWDPRWRRPSHVRPAVRARNLPTFWYREPGLWLPISCAIAFVGGTNGSQNNGGTGLTYACDFGSGATIGFIGVTGGIAGVEASDITAITYAGASASFIDKITSGVQRYIDLWWIASPASGSNNIVITASTNHYLLSSASGYSGSTSLDGSPDQDSAPGGNNVTMNPVSTVDNCWGVVTAGHSYNGGGVAAGTGCVKRYDEGTFFLNAMLDSDGPKTPAGALSMQVIANDVGAIAQAFKPTVAAGSIALPLTKALRIPLALLVQ